MFLADNLGFFAGLNDFKFALRSRLRIVLWLGTTVHFGRWLWVTFWVIFLRKNDGVVHALVGNFWTISGLLETISTRLFKVKNGSRECPLRYLQPSSYLTRAIAFFIQNFYLCMHLIKK